ncbi:glycosyltransferase [Roseateles sp. DAIF2]|uniref:glycosyltransferase n=1 Tax=Roseateles sp. DAIF2 TaxID=2714952 RepID=UPI0018A27222|nr:glycosyltransferase [Roseateles sp. DAIF2]QPF74576.1 glycosyltransferase [Roseateles sp. DAIF2]
MTSAPSPLTIVHVVFSSRVAGGERHCLDLAEAQAALGHKVHVVGPRRSALAGAVAPGVRYHGLALPLLRGWRLRRVVRRLGAQVCHAHLGPACKATATLGPEVARVGTLHVGYKEHHHAKLDGVICVNQAQRQRLSAYRGRHRVVYNWAPEPTQASQASGPGLRQELGLRPEQLLVGSVGRLHPAKGFDLLMLAFSAQAPADAVLAILGEGKQREELEPLAAADPRIRLLGFRTDVDAALRSLDLFVSASREEAFPLAILEAMRAGVPVISTQTQGPTEMLDQQPATLVPIEDVEALGRAIREQLERIRAVPREQRRPVAYELSRYDRRQSVAQILDFYRELIDLTNGGSSHHV